MQHKCVMLKAVSFFIPQQHKPGFWVLQCCRLPTFLMLLWFVLNSRLMKLIFFIRLKLPLQHVLKRLDSSCRSTFISDLYWSTVTKVTAVITDVFSAITETCSYRVVFFFHSLKNKEGDKCPVISPIGLLKSVFEAPSSRLWRMISWQELISPNRV